MEETIRFTCEWMGYSPAEAKRMCVYELYRDFLRARARQDQQVKSLKKWQNK